MVLPNFLGVGAQKAGTTTLANLLIQHPEIYLPGGGNEPIFNNPGWKEAHFFDKDNRYSKGLSWYEENFFSEVTDEKAIGEITPDYMYFEKVAKRIKEELGDDIKFIFIFRNPVDRAYSHYLMSLRRGYENEDFKQAIKLENERIKQEEFEKSHFSYVDRGFYANKVKRFLHSFPRDNMFFMEFDEFISSTPKVLNEVFEFLGVKKNVEINYDIHSHQARVPKVKFLAHLLGKPPTALREASRLIIPHVDLRSMIVNKLKQINQKPSKRHNLDPEIRDLLLEHYRKDMKELEQLTGLDVSSWLRERAVEASNETE